MNEIITSFIEKLRQQSQDDIIAHWRYCQEDLAIATATEVEQWQKWPIAQLNAKNHISWGAGKQIIWLTQHLIVPERLQNYPIEGLTWRIALTWWAEDAQIFVDGELVQQGDLFDYSTRTLLLPAVKAGDSKAIALRLVSPGHDSGALMRSLSIYSQEKITPNYTENTCPDPRFIADELEILQSYINTFQPEKLNLLLAEISKIDLNLINTREKFEICLTSLGKNLVDKFPKPTNKIHLLGHSHLDLAWLWPVNETWQVVKNTFTSVLNLQKDFPELIFCHSTPAIYAWLEINKPELFTNIKKQIAAGVWEIVGGTWVEPELNLISGESLVRQILYGQLYIKEKFGKLMTIMWVPDSFGFSWQLPQILKQGGIEYFVTQKLRWNDTTKFPYGVFWWQSPDGSKIFSLMSALIGEGIEAVKMAKYCWEWETQTKLKDALWLPGVGDHGGGPTRDMLELGRLWQKSLFLPEISYSSAQNYLDGIKRDLETLEINQEYQIPIWNDELYLELHRGCYTTHGDQKRYNRKCEGLLYQAELFATLANIINSDIYYPKEELEIAWKKVLFNQFHDILPGSSIREVYIDADRDWQEAQQTASEILQKSLKAIAAQINLPPAPENSLPVLVFNPLNWQRSEVVAVDLPTPAPSGHKWQISDYQKQPIISQIISQNSAANQLLFLAENIPAIGYCLYWLHLEAMETIENTPLQQPDGKKYTKENHNITTRAESYTTRAKKSSIITKDAILENQNLRIKIDSKTGNLTSIYDKNNHREISSKEGCNQIQAFTDKGQYWDGWNIDPNYEQNPLPSPTLKSIEWIEQGEIEQRIRIIKQIGKSQISQDYILQTTASTLKIATKINWQEKHILLKAAFPVTVTAETAVYEIPCGAINRPTNPTEPREKAKWEVPALNWGDLSAKDYGISILNDSKYGYDAKPNQLRITLLRSPNWPDPEADQGYHEFTYTIYPHKNTWQAAETVQKGYELNLPLQVITYPKTELSIPEKPRLSPTGKFLELSPNNLILMAFKPAENQSWIMRCYECYGQPAKLSLKSDINLKIFQAVDILERKIEIAGEILEIKPWEIRSFEVKIN